MATSLLQGVARLVGEGYERPDADSAEGLDVNYARVNEWMTERRLVPADWPRRLRALQAETARRWRSPGPLLVEAVRKLEEAGFSEAGASGEDGGGSVAGGLAAGVAGPVPPPSSVAAALEACGGGVDGGGVDASSSGSRGAASAAASDAEALGYREARWARDALARSAPRSLLGAARGEAGEWSRVAGAYERSMLHVAEAGAALARAADHQAPAAAKAAERARASAAEAAKRAAEARRAAGAAAAEAREALAAAGLDAAEAERQLRADGGAAEGGADGLVRRQLPVARRLLRAAAARDLPPLADALASDLLAGQRALRDAAEAYAAAVAEANAYDQGERAEKEKEEEETANGESPDRAQDAPSPHPSPPPPSSSSPSPPSSSSSSSSSSSASNVLGVLCRALRGEVAEGFGALHGAGGEAAPLGGVGGERPGASPQASSVPGDVEGLDFGLLSLGGEGAEGAEVPSAPASGPGPILDLDLSDLEGVLAGLGGDDGKGSAEAGAGASTSAAAPSFQWDLDLGEGAAPQAEGGAAGAATAEGTAEAGDVSVWAIELDAAGTEGAAPASSPVPDAPSSSSEPSAPSAPHASAAPWFPYASAASAAVATDRAYRYALETDLLELQAFCACACEQALQGELQGSVAPAAAAAPLPKAASPSSRAPASVCSARACANLLRDPAALAQARDACTLAAAALRSPELRRLAGLAGGGRALDRQAEALLEPRARARRWESVARQADARGRAAQRALVDAREAEREAGRAAREARQLVERALSSKLKRPVRIVGGGLKTAEAGERIAKQSVNPSGGNQGGN